MNWIADTNRAWGLKKCVRLLTNHHFFLIQKHENPDHRWFVTGYVLITNHQPDMVNFTMDGLDHDGMLWSRMGCCWSRVANHNFLSTMLSFAISGCLISWPTMIANMSCQVMNHWGQDPAGSPAFWDCKIISFWHRWAEHEEPQDYYWDSGCQ